MPRKKKKSKRHSPRSEEMWGHSPDKMTRTARDTEAESCSDVEMEDCKERLSYGSGSDSDGMTSDSAVVGGSDADSDYGKQSPPRSAASSSRSESESKKKFVPRRSARLQKQQQRKAAGQSASSSATQPPICMKRSSKKKTRSRKPRRKRNALSPQAASPDLQFGDENGVEDERDSEESCSTPRKPKKGGKKDAGRRKA